jgi:hypothetical protein
VKTASYSVSVNGDLFGFFNGKYGVCQEDPLSPYLFLACMEYFSRMLTLSTQQTTFNFHLKCRAFGISYLAFADNILFLYSCDVLFVSILHQQLLFFGLIYGLDAMPLNLLSFFSGIGEANKLSFLQLTGFSKGQFPFKYLGVPLSPHRLLTSQYFPLLHKLESFNPELDGETFILCWLA